MEMSIKLVSRGTPLVKHVPRIFGFKVRQGGDVQPVCEASPATLSTLSSDSPLSTGNPDHAAAISAATTVRMRGSTALKFKTFRPRRLLFDASNQADGSTGTRESNTGITGISMLMDLRRSGRVAAPWGQNPTGSSASPAQTWTQQPSSWVAGVVGNCMVPGHDSRAYGHDSVLQER